MFDYSLLKIYYPKIRLYLLQPNSNNVFLNDHQLRLQKIYFSISLRSQNNGTK